MTTYKQSGGRRASKLQRGYASEVLSRFDKTGDIRFLRAALEEFSRTGDFSLFCERSQHLARQRVFIRLLLKVRNQAQYGMKPAVRLDELASRFGLSVPTLRRLIAARDEDLSMLAGSDQLFSVLQAGLMRGEAKD